MERKKEQAKVLSQEMLADGIYSLWIETEAEVIIDQEVGK